MPDAEVTTDDVSDSQGAPTGVRKAVDLCALVQHCFEVISLLRGECGHSPGGDGGLERVWTLMAQEVLPGAEGIHGYPEELCEFLAAVLAGFEEFEEVLATFCELSSREVRGQPSVSHSPSLPF